MAERSEIEPFELHALLSADGDGPAQRIDAAAQARLIDNVLAGAQLGHTAETRSPETQSPETQSPETQSPETKVAPLRPRGSKRKLAWSLAAAFVITGSAAAMYTAQRARETESQRERDAAATRRAHAAAPETVVVSSPAVPAVVPTPAVPAVVPTPAVPAVAAPAVTQAAPSAPAPRPQTVASTERRTSAPNLAVDLLKQANHLRGDGDYRAAESAYQKVVTENPRSAAAYAARVAAAGLRLERLSDPSGALRLYSQALRQTPDGALSPEIHEGMANAYRALGRASDEQRTLRALLREQASGPAAERARARLAVLDGRQ